jgi:hypothetical protein
METVLLGILAVAMLLVLSHAYYASSTASENEDTHSPVQPDTVAEAPLEATDPSPTTSQLVGNGLAYFVLWFVAAPIIILFSVFAFGPLAGGIPAFLGMLLVIPFLYHTFEIINLGFNARVAPDEPTAKTAFISATPQSNSGEERISCPMCAEKILPQAKICHFCKSVLNPTQSD